MTDAAKPRAIIEASISDDGATFTFVFDDGTTKKTVFNQRVTGTYTNDPLVLVVTSLSAALVNVTERLEALEQVLKTK